MDADAWNSTPHPCHPFYHASIQFRVLAKIKSRGSAYTYMASPNFVGSTVLKLMPPIIFASKGNGSVAFG